MHCLLVKQIADATLPSGAVDADRLIRSIQQVYEDIDRDRKLTDRSITLMVEENELLNAELRANVAAVKLQNERFIGAIERLSHGLCIYDVEWRLVIANNRYGNLYQFPPGFLKPGVPLADVVANATERGIYPDEAVVDDTAGTIAEVQQAGACERTRHLADGRIIHITFNRLTDGGWIALHKDVTSEYLAEERLAESEQRFRDFAATASDWCWEMDESHRYTFFTPAFQILTGIDPATLIGQTRTAFADMPEDGPVLGEFDRLVEARQPISNVTFRYLKPDGSVAWVRSSGLPRFDKAGRFLGYRGTGTDVTLEQEQRRALAQSEARLRDFIETASDWTWETDPEGHVVSLSRSYDTNGAFSRSAMIGLRREDHPIIIEHMERMAVGYTARMAQRLPIRDLVYGVHNTNGTISYIRVSGNPFYDNNGEFAGYRGTSTNVTPQFEANLALELSNDRFRDFADAAADMCWETDANHCYIDPDIFMGRPATFGTKDFVGKRRIDLPFVEEDRPLLEEHMRVLEARQPFKDMLYRVPNEDGSIAWIKASGTPVYNAAGVFTGYRGSARDVTIEEMGKVELRRAMEQFRDFAEAASDWFWETDEEHRFRSFSDAYALVAKLSQLNHVGKRRIDFDLHPDCREAIERNHEGLAQRKPFKDLTYRVRGFEGSWVWIKASGKPVVDETGRFLGYRGSASNITEEMEKLELLSRQRQALERAEEVARLGNWRWIAASRTFEWSSSVYDIFGICGEERRPELSLLVQKVHPEDRGVFIGVLKRLERGENVGGLELRVLAAAGDLRYIHLRADVEWDSSGGLIGTFGIVQDITERKLAELELKQRSERLLEAQRLGRIGEWSFANGSAELWLSPEIYELLGYAPGAFQPTPAAIMKLFAAGTGRLVLDAQSEVLRSRQVRSVDVKAMRGDGSLGDFVVTTKALLDDVGRVCGFAGTIQDISERKLAERQLEKLAYYDPLTGLANRALFRREVDDVLARSARSRTKAALLLLDLDRFKEVNDSLGHAAGDELLAQVSRKIAHILGDGRFLARLGGDEFAIIVPEGDDSEAVSELASRIVATLAQPIMLERGEVVIGTSIGIVLAPRDGSDFEELLRHADLALYRAKEEGRGRFAFFQSDMNDLVQQKTALARDLRHAAASGSGLEVRYQAQVDLGTSRVVGFETLMRWSHPDRGYVPPSEFIPIAESSSLICDIGLWIMRESTRQAKRWLDEGEDAREIAVNVSAAQIWQTDFERDVASVLKETGLPAHLLCLELTESLFADHSEGRVRRALAGLKALGVTLALDDFGTGYSSLGYLTQLPFDKLKIDRVFVDGIVGSSRKRKLLEGIVALGRGLGMTVIAEGAELPEEVEILRGFGCERVQGYVFARPVVAAEALAFARDRDASYRDDPALMAGSLRNLARKAG